MASFDNGPVILATLLVCVTVGWCWTTTCFAITDVTRMVCEAMKRRRRDIEL